MIETVIPNQAQLELFAKATETSQMKEHSVQIFRNSVFESYEKGYYPNYIRLNVKVEGKDFPLPGDCNKFINSFQAFTGKYTSLNINNSKEKNLEFYLMSNSELLNNLFRQYGCSTGCFNSAIRFFSVGDKLIFEFAIFHEKEIMQKNQEFTRFLIDEFGENRKIEFVEMTGKREVDQILVRKNRDSKLPSEESFFNSLPFIAPNYTEDRQSFSEEMLFNILPTLMKSAFRSKLNFYLNYDKKVADKENFVFHSWLGPLTVDADKRGDSLYGQKGIDFSFRNLNLPVPVVDGAYDEDFYTFKTVTGSADDGEYFLEISKSRNGIMFPGLFNYSEAKFWVYFSFWLKKIYLLEFREMKEIYNRFKSMPVESAERSSFFVEENKIIEGEENVSGDIVKIEKINGLMGKYACVDLADARNPKMIFVNNRTNQTNQFNFVRGNYSDEEVTVTLANKNNYNMPPVQQYQPPVQQYQPPVQQYQPPVQQGQNSFMRPSSFNQQAPGINLNDVYYQPLSIPEEMRDNYTTQIPKQQAEKSLNFGYKITNQELVDLHNIHNPTDGKEIVVKGVVFNVVVEKKQTKNKDREFQICLISVTNKKNSIYAKRLLNLDSDWDVEGLEGKEVLIEGKITFDAYMKSLVMELNALNVIGEVAKRKDDALEKRVELHFHSKMSDQDGVNDIKSVVKTLSEWGHTALALTDHGVAHGFVEAYLATKKMDNFKMIYGVEMYMFSRDIGLVLKAKEAAKAKKKSKAKKVLEEFEKVEIKPYEYFHVNVLSKNKPGLKNLYELMTESHLKYYYRKPLISKQMLKERREGLLIGTACERGDVVNKYLSGGSEDEIKDLIKFYDFVEIMPIANNAFMVKKGMIESIDNIKKMNMDLYRLAKEASKEIGREILVVATSDSHFFNPEDGLFREELLAIKGMMDENPSDLHFRTTESMLAEFFYMGKDIAYEVVVKNTNAIAEQIEKLKILPDKLQIPEISGASEEVFETVNKRITEKYGNPLPMIVQERVDKELSSINKYGYEVIYWICSKLVEKSNQDGYLVGSRGSVGSSLVAHMMNITELNPLQPHYWCPNCKNSIWDNIDNSINGRELPSIICPNCQSLMFGEGDHIPFETFVGFKGEKVPDIDLNFASDYQERIHKYTEEFLAKHASIYRAGTINTIAAKSAIGYALNYQEKKLEKVIYGKYPKEDKGRKLTAEEKLEEKKRYKDFLVPMFKREHADLYYQVSMHEAEIKRLAKGVEGVRKTTGQHPGGLILIPKGDVSNYFPLQHPANDEQQSTITIHFADKIITDYFLKIDALGHDSPRMLKLLKDSTGVDSGKVPLNDQGVLSLFTSSEKMNYVKKFDVEIGTLGIPEFGSEFVIGVLKEAKPTTVTELCLICGLTHGTNVWNNNAQDLIRAGKNLKEVICVRDDIMIYLMKMNIPSDKAFKITEKVRKGKKLSEEEIGIMKQYNIPEWYIQSCQKIEYLFPKAHAVAYTLMSLRIAYFKVYYPTHFYAAYLSTKSNLFNADVLFGNYNTLYEAVFKIKEKKDKSAKDKDEYVVYYIALECVARGIEFLPVDIFKSAELDFLVAGEKHILPPLVTIGNLGHTAAKKIVVERQLGEFAGVDDFKKRCGLNKNSIGNLEKVGALKVFESS